jgi:hypothetical protein
MIYVFDAQLPKEMILPLLAVGFFYFQSLFYL